jgi:limonene-1,2-epoxide hydrolase
MTNTSRRTFFTSTAMAAAATLVPRRLLAAAPSAAEQANIKVVTDFCAAWASHDLNKVMSFFADNCAYRVSETRDPVKGRDAVTATIKGFLDRVVRFEVLDTYAKGPMVFNERIDHFTPGGQMPLKSWHGVGVFFLTNGKIVEWQDYTMSMERA